MGMYLIVAFGPKMLLGINKENSEELVQFTFFFSSSFRFISSTASRLRDLKDFCWNYFLEN